MTSVTHTSVASRSPTGRGLVLCVFPGSDAARLHDLAARFVDHDVIGCPPDEVRGRVNDAIRTGRPFVGIADDGEDVRVAVEVLAHSDTALLPLPSATANGFAHALGIETIDDAVKTAELGTVRVMSLGRVNGRAFVNASSLGFIPHGGGRRDLLATWRALRAGKRVVIELDRRPVAAWFVFVGNGCFGERMTDLATRERLDDNLLDVRVARADRRFARTRLVGAALSRRRASRTPVLDRRTCREIGIDVCTASTVDVTVDGCNTSLETPLRYSSEADALRVLVPEIAL